MRTNKGSLLIAAATLIVAIVAILIFTLVLSDLWLSVAGIVLGTVAAICIIIFMMHGEGEGTAFNDDDDIKMPATEELDSKVVEGINE